MSVIHSGRVLCGAEAELGCASDEGLDRARLHVVEESGHTPPGMYNVMVTWQITVDLIVPPK